MKKRRKGQTVVEISKQLLCNFVDGMSRHLVNFYAVAADEGYAGTIESRRETFLSPMQSNVLHGIFIVSNTVVSISVAGIVHLAVYARTICRKIIDVAAKIVATSGKIVLKVTTATLKNVKFDILWERSGSPPQFICD